MNNMMTFPKTIDEFIDLYQFVDRKEVYTNGSELIQVFRVQQALDHYLPKWISVKERLPEEDGEYLAGWYGSDEVVLARFTNDCFGMRFSLCNPEKEHRPAFYYVDDEWGTCEWKDIECWMQLPEPPEVEE